MRHTEGWGHRNSACQMTHRQYMSSSLQTAKPVGAEGYLTGSNQGRYRNREKPNCPVRDPGPVCTSTSVWKQHDPVVPFKTSVPLLTPYFLPFSSLSVWRHMHATFPQFPGVFSLRASWFIPLRKCVITFLAQGTMYAIQLVGDSFEWKKFCQKHSEFRVSA